MIWLTDFIILLQEYTNCTSRRCNNDTRHNLLNEYKDKLHFYRLTRPESTSFCYKYRTKRLFGFEIFSPKSGKSFIHEILNDMKVNMGYVRMFYTSNAWNTLNKESVKGNVDLALREDNVDNSKTENESLSLNDEVIIKKKYPNPKNVLHNCFHVLWQELQRSDLVLSPSFKFVETLNNWSCTYHLKWPKDIKFSKYG